MVLFQSFGSLVLAWLSWSPSPILPTPVTPGRWLYEARPTRHASQRQPRSADQLAPFVPWYLYPVIQVTLDAYRSNEYYADLNHDMKLHEYLLDEHPRHICANQIEASLLPERVLFMERVSADRLIFVYFECHHDTTTCCYLHCCGYNPETSFRMALTVSVLFVSGIVCASLLTSYRHLKKLYEEWLVHQPSSKDWLTTISVFVFGNIFRYRQGGAGQLHSTKRERYINAMRAVPSTEFSSKRPARRRNVKESLRIWWRRVATIIRYGHTDSNLWVHQAGGNGPSPRTRTQSVGQVFMITAPFTVKHEDRPNGNFVPLICTNRGPTIGPIHNIDSQANGSAVYDNEVIPVKRYAMDSIDALPKVELLRTKAPPIPRIYVSHSKTVLKPNHIELGQSPTRQQNHIDLSKKSQFRHQLSDPDSYYNEIPSQSIMFSIPRANRNDQYKTGRRLPSAPQQTPDFNQTSQSSVDHSSRYNHLNQRLASDPHFWQTRSHTSRPPREVSSVDGEYARNGQLNAIELLHNNSNLSWMTRQFPAEPRSQVYVSTTSGDSEVFLEEPDETTLV